MDTIDLKPGCFYYRHKYGDIVKIVSMFFSNRGRRGVITDREELVINIKKTLPIDNTYTERIPLTFIWSEETHKLRKSLSANNGVVRVSLYTLDATENSRLLGYVPVTLDIPKIGDSVLVLPEELARINAKNRGRTIRKCESPHRLIGCTDGMVGKIIKTTIVSLGNSPMLMMKFDRQLSYKGKNKNYNTDNYFVHADSVIPLKSSSEWDDVQVSEAANEILDELSELVLNPYEVITYAPQKGIDARYSNVTTSTISKNYETIKVESLPLTDEDGHEKLKVNKNKKLLLS